MFPALIKAAAAFALSASLAYTAVDEEGRSPAYGESLTALSQSVFEDHAGALFVRIDRNQDGALDIDEYAAHSIVRAELAMLNGFVSIGESAAPGVIDLGSPRARALTRYEHIEIDARARSAFYQHAGEDGQMTEDQFIASERLVFDAVDFNGNGVLKRAELAAFALRQTMLSPGV